ncbi:hypothetical protein SDC9_182422 [bioreactor metagenome]|uniref:Uncharacterized protein n=1 Tax=bioreactor metagenome TaxID=1076179 RepID=A0A645H7H9_9ZZZZ
MIFVMNRHDQFPEAFVAHLQKRRRRAGRFPFGETETVPAAKFIPPRFRYSSFCAADMRVKVPSRQQCFAVRIPESAMQVVDGQGNSECGFDSA